MWVFPWARLSVWAWVSFGAGVGLGRAGVGRRRAAGGRVGAGVGAFFFSHVSIVSVRLASNQQLDVS